MNAFTIALAYIRLRPLHTGLNLALLALGIMTISLLMLFTEQLEGQMTRDAQGIDMVVGAKGSPMQLILSGIYHLDVPTGNIPLVEANTLAVNPMIKETIPLALGDSFRGFRIVGTDFGYLDHYGGSISAGRLWEVPLEVVLGALVARDLGLKAGDQFIASHGFADGGSTHGKDPYRVGGVLEVTGTVIDRLILTAVESVWSVHGHQSDAGVHSDDSVDHTESSRRDQERGQHSDHVETSDNREITVLLVKFSSPIALVTLPRLINTQTTMQAALPGYEISRLFKLVGVGLDGFRAFAMVLVLSAGVGIFTALYNALSERRYDIAVFRALGASKPRVFRQFLFEGLLLSLMGALIGLILGHLTAELAGTWLWREHQLYLSGLTLLREELWLLGLSGVIGIVAGLFPAIRAYRIDVAGVLARG